jgi:hypothetical protein
MDRRGKDSGRGPELDSGGYVEVGSLHVDVYVLVSSFDLEIEADDVPFPYPLHVEPKVPSRDLEYYGAGQEKPREEGCLGADEQARG